MATLDSALDPNSEEYRQNREALLTAVDEFRAIEQAVVDTAESKRAKFESVASCYPMSESHGCWMPARLF